VLLLVVQGTSAAGFEPRRWFCLDAAAGYRRRGWAIAAQRSCCR